MLSSFAPPVVGILAERFYGYKPISYGPGQSSSVQVDRENAASLAKALYIAIAIPMTLCCFIYFFLYFTYPRDRERAQMDSLIESELQEIELENYHSELQLSERDLGENETSVIDIVYGEEDVGTDDSDETLLFHQE